MSETSYDPAELFSLFWHNSVLDDSHAPLLGERIAVDAAQVSETPRPRHASAAIPLPADESGLSAIWQRRTSRHDFSPLPMSLSEAGQLLRPLGVRDGNPDRRLLPSAGAKYPLLTYAALLNIGDAPTLNRRLCWYDPSAHGLVPFAAVPDWSGMQKILGTDWDVPPAMVVFAVADGQGMLEKYGERGGRFILLEAGAHMAALSLQAAEAGLAGIALGSFHDAKVLSLLNLRASRHMVALAYACGKAS